MSTNKLCFCVGHNLLPEAQPVNDDCNTKVYNEDIKSEKKKKCTQILFIYTIWGQ